MLRVSATYALLLFGAFLFFLGGSWYGIYWPQYRLAALGVVAALVLAWRVAGIRDKFWRPTSVMWPSIVALLASLAASTLTSRNPRISLEYLGYAAVLVVLYLFLVRLLAHPFVRPRLVAFAALMFVSLVVLYVGMNLLLWVLWWIVLGHLAAPPLRPGFEGLTFGNPAAVVVLVGLLTGPAYIVLARAGRGTRVGVALIAASIAVVALLSGSRGAWFALSTAIVIGLVIGLATGVAQLKARELLIASRDHTARTFIALGLILLVADLMAPTVLQRAGAGGEAVRGTYWVTAIRMWLSAPLTGTGPGSWAILRPAYTEAGEWDEYVPYAHNLEIQTVSELGFFGALAGAVVVANVLWLVKEALRGPDRERRSWAAIAVLGLSYFVVQQQFDFYVNLPSVLFAAAFPVAMLDATAQGPPSLGGRRLVWPRLLGTALSILLIPALGGLAVQEWPASLAGKAVVLANDGKWLEAEEPAAAAAAIDPLVGSYPFTAGLVAAATGDHASAVRYFEEVVAHNDLPEAWLDLAAEQVLIGQPQEAKSSLARAYRVGVLRPDVAVGVADVAIRLGDGSLAVDAAGAAISQLPSLASDPWWRAPEWAELQPRVLEAARDKARPDDLWDLLLESGDPMEALASSGDSIDRDFAPLVIQAWSGEPSARELLLRRCEAEPLRTRLVYWCARLAGRAGDTRLQSRYRYLVSWTPAATFEGGVTVRVTRERLEGRSLAGSPAIWWGIYSYRRMTPWDLLVPSVAHLTIE